MTVKPIQGSSFMKRSIAHYEDKYDIYDNGQVYNKLTGKWKILQLQSNGYVSTSLDKKTHSIHRLVALHFLPNPYGYTQVNHIDGNKENNNVTNLEWCSPIQNTQHALSTGLRKGGIPYEEKLILLNRTLQGELIVDLAKELPNTHQNTLHKMLRKLAKEKGWENEWSTEMQRRRKTTAIKNLEKVNS